MAIYISKNSQRLGPYSREQVHAFLADGTFSATDFAWREGLPDWVPLGQFEGIGGNLPRGPVPAVAPSVGNVSPDQTGEAPRKRPVGVWIISLLYFIFVPLGLLSFGLVYAIISGAFPIPPEQLAPLQKAFTPTVLLFGVFSSLLALMAAILLFLLKRVALYFFIFNFTIGLAQSGMGLVNAASMGTPNLIGAVFGAVIGLAFSGAILSYVIVVYRNGTLR